MADRQPAPAAPAPQTEAAAQAETVEDLIDGYVEMSKPEKVKAVRAFAATTGDPRIKQILAAEYSKLFNDADEYAGKKFQGVVPEGWQQ